jgi:hypothetical protein
MPDVLVGHQRQAGSGKRDLRVATNVCQDAEVVESTGFGGVIVK